MIATSRRRSAKESRRAVSGPASVWKRIVAHLNDSDYMRQAVADLAAVLFAPTAGAALTVVVMRLVSPGIGELLRHSHPLPGFPMAILIGGAIAWNHALNPSRHARFVEWIWAFPFALLAMNHVLNEGMSQALLAVSEFTSGPANESFVQVLAVSPLLGALTYTVVRRLAAGRGVKAAGGTAAVG
ncbi:MAG: hypothetical protein WBG54_08710 [Acidobacteriaceae bacterium]